jgi:protein-S-isoprenylcysteine O-methyltransferase Ste14
MRWVWGAWFISWLIAASWANRTEARPQRGAEALYRVLTLAGVVLLFVSDRYASPELKLWETPTPLGWSLAGLTLAGFLFCWWARLHLGRMWSSSVTRKTDHHIVDTGPYALVRHPIYTGIITASAAMAAAEGTVAGLAGLGLVVLGFWIKARLEERFLRIELGAAVYDEYAKRTGMLFPGL